MRYAILALLLACLVPPRLVVGAPGPGDPLPEVSAFDAEGEAFPLREKLAGKPAVIVFGCLT